MIILLQILLFILIALVVIYLQRFLSKSLNLIAILGFVVSSAFVFFPVLLTQVASFFGIGRGVDFAFYLIIPVIAIVAIRSGLSARKNSDKIVQLTRAEALENFKRTYGQKLDK